MMLHDALVEQSGRTGQPLPAGEFFVSRQIPVRTLVGAGRGQTRIVATKAIRGGVLRIETGSQAVGSIVGLTLDGGPSAVGIVNNNEPGGLLLVDDVAVEMKNGSGLVAIKIHVSAGPALQATISRCEITGAAIGVRFQGAVSGQIRECQFELHSQHAIALRSTTQAAPNNVHVLHCQAANPFVGGLGQAFCAFGAAGLPITQLQLFGNQFAGTGRPHDDGGTADLVVLQGVVGALLAQNVIAGSGGNGLVVGHGSSIVGICGNLVAQSTHHGCHFGTFDDGPTAQLVVRANTIRESGRDRERNPGVDVYSGVYCQNVLQSSFLANRIVEAADVRGPDCGFRIGKLCRDLSIVDNRVLFRDVEGVEAVRTFGDAANVFVRQTTVAKLPDVGGGE